MGSVDDLQIAAEEYLGACIDALNMLTADGAPDRAYISPGPPAYDCCPMLAVHVGGSQIAATRIDGGALAEGHRIAVTGVVDQASLTATILRCEPPTWAALGGKPPPAAQMTAFASKLNQDVWAIRNWIVARKAEGVLFAGTCREMSLGPARAIVEQGLCGGWEIPITVTVDGFTPPAT